jgi:hypothetical protein
MNAIRTILQACGYAPKSTNPREPVYGYSERELMEAAWAAPLGSATHRTCWVPVSKPGSNQLGMVATNGSSSWATKAMTDRIVYIKRRFIESLYKGKNARI